MSGSTRVWSRCSLGARRSVTEGLGVRAGERRDKGIRLSRLAAHQILREPGDLGRRIRPGDSPFGDAVHAVAARERLDDVRCDEDQGTLRRNGPEDTCKRMVRLDVEGIGWLVEQ